MVKKNLRAEWQNFLWGKLRKPFSEFSSSHYEEILFQAEQKRNFQAKMSKFFFKSNSEKDLIQAKSIKKV